MNLSPLHIKILKALREVESIITQPGFKRDFEITVPGDKRKGRKAERFKVPMDDVGLLIAEGLVDGQYVVTEMGQAVIRGSACKKEVKP